MVIEQARSLSRLIYFIFKLKILNETSYVKAIDHLTVICIKDQMAKEANDSYRVR